MLFQNYQEFEFSYPNGITDKMKVYDKFFYDDKNILKCPNCNNLIFYVENKIIHKCPFNNEIYEINEDVIKCNSNKFKCDINKINNIICVNHQKEFLYYKDSNYYCSLCLREKKLKDYLSLDLIIQKRN